MVGSEHVWNGFIHTCQTTIDQWSPSEVWLDLGCGTAEVLERLCKYFYMGVDSNRSYIGLQRKYPRD